MKITVKLYALLGSYLPPQAADNQIDVEVDEGATPASIFAEFHVPPENCHLVLVNGVFVAPGERASHLLKDNDVVAAWPPIAGGDRS
ncbi:MAG: MoaD/ThiS family protein [Alphaproteobacteria bacterium]|nr:MoaD/ThiS family protein [Alphaproteobacteria bacterium]